MICMKWTTNEINHLLHFDLWYVEKKPGSVRLNTTEIGITNPNAPGQVKLQVTEMMAGEIVAYQNLYLLQKNWPDVYCRLVSAAVETWSRSNFKNKTYK